MSGNMFFCAKGIISDKNLLYFGRSKITKIIDKSERCAIIIVVLVYTFES